MAYAPLVIVKKLQTVHFKITNNLAKLDDGLAKSPTVMVGETKNKQKMGENRGILKPSWAFVKANISRLQNTTAG